MRGSPFRKSTIPKKYCFYIYLLTGSHNLAARHIREKGFLSPETGKPFSSTSIYNAIIRGEDYKAYMVKHLGRETNIKLGLLDQDERIKALPSIDELREAEIWVQVNEPEILRINKQDVEAWKPVRDYESVCKSY